MKWKLRRGRIYIINPGFQYKFMAYTIFASVSCLAVIYGANYYFFQSFLAKGLSLGLPENHAFFRLIQEQQEFMNKIFLVVSVIITTGLAFWGVLFSHRMAGPLYRLNKFFLDLAEQEQKNPGQKVSELSFRNKDFFKELTHGVNAYFESRGLLTDEKEKLSAMKEIANDEGSKKDDDDSGSIPPVSKAS